MLQPDLHNIFQKIYNCSSSPITIRAPGRVNLIGEHTDYNGGYVLPAAIDRWITIGAFPRDDDNYKLYSVDFDEHSSFSIKNIKKDSPQWANYPKGVIHFLRENQLITKGMDAVIHGDIPLGIGLSSSAAFELATAFTLQTLFHFDLSMKDMVKLCQKAENQFVGVNCGIMDQFISGFGKKDMALFLDCQTLEYKHIPFQLGDWSLVAVNSGISHQLVKSEYNLRRQQCEDGVKLINQYHAEHTGKVSSFQNLRQVDMQTFSNYAHRFPPVIAKRCHHVISENNRVLQAVEVLRNNDLKSFGELMNQSHISLRDDYEVSCPEVDCLVDSAWNFTDCLGSRMTGGGFGGCTINLVKTDQIEKFKEHISQQYKKSYNQTAQFFVFKVVNGVERISENTK